MSQNRLKQLAGDSMARLGNLVTIDLSYNELQSLQGVQSLTRLKRLVACNNQLRSLRPLCGLKTLVEIDVESNPIEEW